uniref:Uncharacterized protein n=1 Tax=Burkholderia phage vB_BgluM-SURPRISE13 TaxID=3159457 RepID=A0AAU7PEZ6_9VIRU
MAIAPEDQQGGHDEPDLTMPDETQVAIDPQNVQLPKQDKNYDSGKTPLMTDAAEDDLKPFQGVLIPMLPDNASRVNDDMTTSKMGDVDVHEESVDWYQTLLNGFRSVPAHGVFEDALADPNAEWRNALSFNSQNINVGRPKFSNRGRGSKMSSERLMLSVKARLGLGSPVQVPLVGSGFYGTVKPLEEVDIIRLWREVIAEPIKLGRATHGLMFANNSVFTAKAVYESWAASLVETTVSDLPAENLPDHITINDLPLIAQSIATSIYPNGFPMSRAVFTEDTKLPKEKISQIIDLRKALFMNRKMFKDEQLAHMTKRIEQPMTLKQIKEYKDQFVFNQNTIVDIGEGVKLHLYTPSLREYFDSGEKWINEIQASVHEALGADADEKKRMQYISQLAKASRLRQYSHYVKSIEEDGELYTTRENVDKVLTSLSASDEVSQKFFKAISDYINNTQVAIIATTSVNEYEDAQSGDKWPRLIALDAISVFFQLVEQKLLGITSRALEATSD